MFGRNKIWMSQALALKLVSRYVHAVGRKKKADLGACHHDGPGAHTGILFGAREHDSVFARAPTPRSPRELCP